MYKPRVTDGIRLGVIVKVKVFCLSVGLLRNFCCWMHYSFPRTPSQAHFRIMMSACGLLVAVMQVGNPPSES